MCPEMRDEQLNTRLPRALKQKIKSEALRTGKTVEIIVMAALSDFFKSWTANEREKFYAPHKPYARNTTTTK